MQTSFIYIFFILVFYIYLINLLLLFLQMSLPIAFPAATHPDKASSGEDWVILSESGDGLYYLLEYNSPPDNRYNIKFISAYLDALDYLRLKCQPKVLVTTSRLPKFFSNGLDFEMAITTPGFFDQYYYRLMRTMLEFPWPTVAVVNGHAFAAGFMIVACHDYAVMNPDKGFLCMNEVAFGAELKPPMMSIFRVKYGARLTRKITLQGHRFTSKEALEVGIIDARGGIAEAEEIIKNVASKYVLSPSYAAIRKELLKEVISDTLSFDKNEEIANEVYHARENYYDAREKDLDQKLKLAQSKL